MSEAVDPDRVRAAVSAFPGIVRVEGDGPNGVNWDPDELEVHVVVRYGLVLPELGERVERELGPLLGGRSLTLVVEDVLTDTNADTNTNTDADTDPGPAPRTGGGVPAGSPVAGAAASPDVAPTY